MASSINDFRNRNDKMKYLIKKEFIKKMKEPENKNKDDYKNTT